MVMPTKHYSFQFNGLLTVLVFFNQFVVGFKKKKFEKLGFFSRQESDNIELIGDLLK